MRAARWISGYVVLVVLRVQKSGVGGRGGRRVDGRGGAGSVRTGPVGSGLARACDGGDCGLVNEV